MPDQPYSNSSSPSSSSSPSPFNNLFKKILNLPRKVLNRILLILALILCLRIILPYAIEYAINYKLDQKEGFTGRVNDVDLVVLLGKFQIEDIRIERTKEYRQGGRPHFSLKSQAFGGGLNWKMLFQGALEMNLWVESPHVDFLAAMKKDAEEKQRDQVVDKNKGPLDTLERELKDWWELFTYFYPYKARFTKIAIRNGQFHFKDPWVEPKVDLFLKEIYATGTNFTVVRDYLKGAYMQAEMQADFMKSGKFKMDLKIDPLVNDPKFDLNTQIIELPLPELNDFFKSYANLDIENGNFNLFMEVAVKEKKFVGYIKPLYEDLDVLKWKKDIEEDNLLQVFWEAIVGGVGEILENSPTERLATKIPFTGTFGRPDVGVWEAVIELLRNGFIRALAPKLDLSVNLETLEKVDQPKELVE